MSLGKLYFRIHDFDKAAGAINLALTMSNGDRDIPPDWQASMLETLAALHNRRGEHEIELKCCREAIKIYNAVYGVEHERTAVSHVNEASALKFLGRYKEARDVLLPALSILESTVGMAHSHTAKVYYVLAQVCCLEGNYQEAMDWCQKAMYADNKVKLPADISFGLRTLYAQLGDKLLQNDNTEFVTHKDTNTRET